MVLPFLTCRMSCKWVFNVACALFFFFRKFIRLLLLPSCISLFFSVFLVGREFLSNMLTPTVSFDLTPPTYETISRPIISSSFCLSMLDRGCSSSAFFYSSSSDFGSSDEFFPYLLAFRPFYFGYWPQEAREDSVVFSRTMISLDYSALFITACCSTLFAPFALTIPSNLLSKTTSFVSPFLSNSSVLL